MSHLRFKFQLIDSIILALLIGILIFSSCSGSASKKDNLLSTSFEVRYVTQNLTADGETDFNGKDAGLTMEQRVHYLKEYARFARTYFGDDSMDTQIVPIEKAREVLSTIKSQPLPKIRKRIILDEWQCTGYRPELQFEREVQLNEWKKLDGVVVKDGALVFEEATTVVKSLDVQNWRCFLDWKVQKGASRITSKFNLDSAVVIGFDEKGEFFYQTDGQTKAVSLPDEDIVFRVDLDFVNSRYNLYANDKLVADFVKFTDPSKQQLACLEISGKAGLTIGHVWGTAYQRQEDARKPITIKTFIDETFHLPPAVEGWTRSGYDDSTWEAGILPIAHGSERYAGQDLLLRKQVDIGVLSEKAVLSIESLTPGGAVFINGKLVLKIDDVSPRKIDVRKYLKTGKNLFAVKVNADKVKQGMTHTHSDPYTGWFAGRMHLDLMPSTYIKDVFTWTKSLSRDSAEQQVRFVIKNSTSHGEQFTVEAELAPWFPEEGPVVLSRKWTISTSTETEYIDEKTISVNVPQLWTPDTPNLYQLKIKLVDATGIAVDDFVTTLGLRTISQDGGTFRLNGQAEILRAPLVFGSRAPMDKITLWDRCPPAEYHVQDMLMTRKMNGNGLRLSYHDELQGGVNDPRIAEFADQLGLMLVWQTSAWLRETKATNLDMDLLGACVKEVRNHPSIVIWQPMNHPIWGSWESTMNVYNDIYNTITPLDKSRLISPSADSRQFEHRNDAGTQTLDGQVDECDSVWTAPLICRGNMGYVLGYGETWPTLRQWPQLEKENYPLYMDRGAWFVQSFLDSKERAHFNFEYDETAAQPNWNIHRGKPTYQVESYEWDYEKGSIGRRLTFDEWSASQAWQAFAGYEVTRKQRWLDYDGFCYCCLRGGPNTGTYQKTLLDYYGQPKLAYYAMRMVFQNILGGSKNVDMVYGPNDLIPIIVMNLGNEKTVTLTVTVKTLDGDVVKAEQFPGLVLSAGRSINDVANWDPKLDVEGLYVFEYSVKEEN